MGDGVQLSGRVLLSTRKALGSIPSTFGGGGRGGAPLESHWAKIKVYACCPPPGGSERGCFLAFPAARS